MKCEYCDNEVPAGVTRCPSCGAAVACQSEKCRSEQPVIVVQTPVANTVQQVAAEAPKSTCLPAYQKSRAAYVIIGFLFGQLGIHNFYAGYVGRGVAQLLITVLSFGLLFWVSWIWAVIEMITVEKDAKGVKFK